MKNKNHRRSSNMLALLQRRDGVVSLRIGGFSLSQQNGQRTYGGPPPNWGSRPPPSRDCEVFIGRLPRMCFEDELIPLFLTAGELYEFRLMLDFSGTNRGYGYAHYATAAEAQRAIEMLNKYEIRPGHQIGVLKSKNNCRLLFGNCNAALDMNSFEEFIRKTTDHVLKVLMFRSFQQLKHTDFRISPEVEEAFLDRMPKDKTNMEFAIVEYETHKAAAVARRILIPTYGQVLAIDWAVPPREKKRFGSGSDLQLPPVERPLAITGKDSDLMCTTKSNAKLFPVPMLLAKPSLLDNMSFVQKRLKTVVNFFKYQLTACLRKSVERSEISLFVYEQVERKILKRISSLEHCSQAVQLIFNYFSCNETNSFALNSEVQELLQEIKFYSDNYVYFLYKRLKTGPSQNPREDNYYINVLPLHLDILFRVILRCDAECQGKLLSGISTGLKWIEDVLQRNDKWSRDFIEEINAAIKEDASSLEKGNAKAVFSPVISQQPPNVASNSKFDVLSPKQIYKNNGNSVQGGSGMENANRVGGNQGLAVVPSFLQGASDLNFPKAKGDHGHYVPIPFSKIGRLNEETILDQGRCPPVPLLPVPPSIMNNVPFMPENFNNVLTYFKYLIKVCVKINSWQMNIPRQVSNEIERKIVDRISNMENCSAGVDLILSYFSWWIKKEPGSTNLGPHYILQEVKIYANGFVNFVWNKTMSSYIRDEITEEFFSKLLPLRLNILYQITLILSSEKQMKTLIPINDGLLWLDQLFKRGDRTTAKQFVEELTRFILNLDPSALEKARSLSSAFCAEIMSRSGPPVVYQVTVPEDETSDRNSISSLTVEIPRRLSISGSENSSDGTLDNYF